LNAESLLQWRRAATPNFAGGHSKTAIEHAVCSLMNVSSQGCGSQSQSLATPATTAAAAAERSVHVALTHSKATVCDMST
jgi:hypothetical protein